MNGPLHNAQFNVLGLVTDGGQLKERYEYTPYGQRQVFTYAGTADPYCMVPMLMGHRHWTTTEQPYARNPYGHQGLHHDEESDLIYNRARMLHPRLARFTQRDPLGYVDGMSTYQYQQSRPVIWRDPTGTVVYHDPSDPPNGGGGPGGDSFGDLEWRPSLPLTPDTSGMTNVRKEVQMEMLVINAEINCRVGKINDTPPPVVKSGRISMRDFGFSAGGLAGDSYALYNNVTDIMDHGLNFDSGLALVSNTAATGDGAIDMVLILRQGSVKATSFALHSRVSKGLKGVSTLHDIYTIGKYQFVDLPSTWYTVGSSLYHSNLAVIQDEGISLLGEGIAYEYGKTAPIQLVIQSAQYYEEVRSYSEINSRYTHITGRPVPGTFSGNSVDQSTLDNLPRFGGP